MPEERNAAFVFDLDGTLVDSVYQHVLAWHEALEPVGIPLAVWRIHRKVGMRGGLFASPLLRKTGRKLTTELSERLQQRAALQFQMDVASEVYRSRRHQERP